jgi:hypothetical protein
LVPSLETNTGSIVRRGGAISVILVALSWIADAVKSHYKDKLVDWAIAHLGRRFGTWLIQNPASILTLCVLVLLIAFVGLLLSLSLAPQETFIVRSDGKPYTNPKARRAAIIFIVVGCVTFFAIFYKTYSYYQKPKTPSPPAGLVVRSTIDVPVVISSGRIFRLTNPQMLCAGGERTAYGLEGLQSLPGGPDLKKPRLVIDGHGFRFQTTSTRPDHLELLVEVDVTNRGEASIAKDWRLCLLQDEKHAVHYDAQRLSIEGDVKTSLADATLESQIGHGRAVRGWLVFYLPIDSSFKTFTGSIECRDYLDRRSFLHFSSE